MKAINKVRATTSSDKNLILFEGDSITCEIQKKGEYDSRAIFN